MPDWITRQLVFQGLHPFWAAVAHSVAVLAAAGLILALHRYERQLVSKPVGRGLLALRLTVLALVLITFLQPVQTWTINEQRAGRIVVGIDQSESMRTTDPQADRAEKLHWARGLGMIGNGPSADQLDAWQSVFDQHKEPDWVADDDDPDPERRKQLSEARKENVLGIFSELNQISREEMARRLLVETPDPLLEQLKKLAKTELFVFAGKVEATNKDQLDEVLKSPSASVRAEITDLAEAMKAGPSQGDATPALGVVLFTDGRQTASASPLTAAATLGGMNVPVFPVLLGTSSRPKDLAIPSLEVPSTVYRGDKPLVKALLQTAGFEGKPLVVELKPADEADADQTQTKTITPTGPLTPIEFELSAAEIGRHQYTLNLPVQEGETHEDNNNRSFTLSVVDDRAKVLVIDGQPRWEFRYLEAAFARDERVDLHTVLFEQPYLRLLPETFFPRTLPVGKTSPFEDLDVVILGDVPPWQLTDEQWTQLETFVSDQGGTLVLSAGKNFLPLAYKSPVMDRLMPVTSVKPVDLTDASALAPPSRRGMRLELTPEGESQLMFHFAETIDDNRKVWERLPGPVWAWLGTSKPGATVWMTALLPEDAALEAERKQALVVHQHYGFGQVVWIGFDSTWRWRHRVGDKYHHQCWGQLVRWAASSKIAAGNEFVRFGPEATEVEVGRDVVLRTRWSPPFLERFPKLTARTELSRVGGGAGELVAVVELQPKKDQPLQWQGRAVNLPAGDYRARLVVANGDLGRQPVEAAFSVRPPQTPELLDTTANRELLAQIAEASGGRLLFADELHLLPKLLRPDQTSEELYRETPLWDHGFMLALFFALLMGEWVLRKWNGLP